MTFHRYSALSLGALLVAGSAWAQDRAYDKVVVDLPENTWVGHTKLPAGKYEMRQTPSPGDASNVILVNEKTDRRFEASAISERAMRPIQQQQTKVILQRVGNDYYLDHIWIAGKEFGYRFPIPAEVLARIEELKQPLTLSATYTAPQTTVAQAAPPPAPAPPPQAQPQPEQPAPQPQAEVPQPAPQPAPEAAPVPAPQPAPAQELPHTASYYWLALAIGAGSLVLALVLRLIARA